MDYSAAAVKRSQHITTDKIQVFHRKVNHATLSFERNQSLLPFTDIKTIQHVKILGRGRSELVTISHSMVPYALQWIQTKQ